MYCRHRSNNQEIWYCWIQNVIDVPFLNASHLPFCHDTRVTNQRNKKRLRENGNVNEGYLYVASRAPVDLRNVMYRHVLHLSDQRFKIEDLNNLSKPKGKQFSKSKKSNGGIHAQEVKVGYEEMSGIDAVVAPGVKNAKDTVLDNGTADEYDIRTDVDNMSSQSILIGKDLRHCLFNNVPTSTTSEPESTPVIMFCRRAKAELIVKPPLEERLWSLTRDQEAF